MKRQTAIQTQKETIPPQMRGFLPHAAVRTTSDHDMPSNGSVETRFGHDFSQIAVRPSGPVISQDYSNAFCPLFPQRCPFGGACHTCPPRVQAKSKIGQPGDKYEKEADRVADQVMAVPAHSTVSCSPPRIQRYAGQATEGSDTAPASIDRVLASSGRPLEPVLLQNMEQRFGYDFLRVRVHSGAVAEQSAQDVSANAYTVGHNIVFGSGQFAPGTQEGRRLVAHELVHVIQQQPDPRSIDLEQSRVNSSSKQDSQPLRHPEPRTESLSRSPHATVIQRQVAPPPDPTTEDCEPWQTEMLTNHLNHARTWVNEAESKVAAYAYVFASSRHSAVPRSPATAAVVRNALQDNFHTTSPGHVLAIKDNFSSLRRELNGAFTYECEDEGCESRAYVRGAFSWIRRLGDIHVCPPWFNCRDYFKRVTTLIHERAHQHPGATDHAYEWERSYGTLTPGDSIDNAESYAVAARQIYHAGARGPGPNAC